MAKLERIKKNNITVKEILLEEISTLKDFYLVNEVIEQDIVKERFGELSSHISNREDIIVCLGELDEMLMRRKIFGSDELDKNILNLLERTKSWLNLVGMQNKNLITMLEEKTAVVNKKLGNIGVGRNAVNSYEHANKRVGASASGYRV